MSSHFVPGFIVASSIYSHLTFQEPSFLMIVNFDQLRRSLTSNRKCCVTRANIDQLALIQTDSLCRVNFPFQLIRSSQIVR